ncbi:hypothetical protein ACFLV5_01280 [Chloroflexota bacterium]
MKNGNRLKYGNWIPTKMLVIFLTLFCISCVSSILIDIGILRGILIAVSLLFGALFIYM